MVRYRHNEGFVFCGRVAPGICGLTATEGGDMKRAWLMWTAGIALLGALVVVLHATHVLPLPPAPPYRNGDQNLVTPRNPWTW
jgi:hypothetical protein